MIVGSGRGMPRENGGRMNEKRGAGFRVLIAGAVLLNLLLLVGQTGSLFDYAFTVSIGLQESVDEITGAGVAWATGFAFGDTVFYIPLSIAGIAGLLRRKAWGMFFMFGALAITVYWPVVNLYAVYAGRDVLALSHDKYVAYSMLLPLIAFYGLWGMIFLYRNRERLVRERGGEECS
jgi:hypothetical protein